MSKKYLFIAMLLTGAFSFAFHPLSAQEIMTVRGRIPASEMQTTLAHEHILVDWIGADSTGYHRWNRSDVVNRVLPYLNEIRRLGIRTLFDCTPAYLGRDPYLLKLLTTRSGVHLVTNTGYYGAVDNKFMPAHAYKETANELAQRWIKDFRQGINGSSVKPGFIKIAVAPEDTLSALHKKIVRAAAKTHKATGLTIVSHTGKDGPAFAQLRLLKKLDVEPSAFVWTHAQNGTKEGYVKAAAQGAWISLDHVTKKPDNIEKYAGWLQFAKEKGFLHRILISHDAGWYSAGQKNGGDYRGYTAISKHLLPALKKKGFTENDINQLMVENPQQAFALD